MNSRIALIHATPLAMEPIANAFRNGWPEAEPMDLLDASLSVDRARRSELDVAMFTRFARLVHYAVDFGAKGVIFTCSAFGPAIDAAAREVSVPVLKPNQAMFDTALSQGQRIGMVATFAPAVSTMTTEFEQAAAESGRDATLTTILAKGAIEALRSGNAKEHDRRVAEAAASLPTVDAVMLAHFSTSRALATVRERIDVPVLAAPEAAVARMRGLLPG